MDNRVILNLPGAIEISRIAELNEARGVLPDLTRDAPVKTLGGLSLIVPTFFNTPLKHHSLRFMMQGLEECRAMKEVVIVSSDGEPGTFSDLGREGALANLRLVNAPPHNRAASRNMGAAAAESEFLLFLDDDMLPGSWRSIDVILSTLIESGLDCALFPKRQYVRFPLLFDGWALHETVNAWKRGEGEDPFLFDPIRDGTKDLPMVFCFPGCFTLIRKEAYERLNGFDERFIGWGYEDTDFALRAMEQLNVLNLFRRVEPFLHIDHPVSPYKSEEYHSNALKFFSDARAVDIHRFSRRVFTGRDFTEDDRQPLAPEIHLEPFREIARRGVPLDVTGLTGWALEMAEKLTCRFAFPYPEFALLHGSRTQRAETGDYDVLCLYDANIQDFYATPGVPRIEIECGSLLFFDRIADAPWEHDFRGILELAKIAKSELLLGSAPAWNGWRGPLLKKAVANGRAFWLVMAVGLQLNRRKYGTLVDRCLASLVRILEDARVPDDLEELIAPDLSMLAHHTATVLDELKAGWREQVAKGRKVFALQVPEVWIGLERIYQISAEASPTRPIPADYASR